MTMPRPLKTTTPGTRIHFFQGPNKGRTGTILSTKGTRAIVQLDPEVEPPAPAPDAKYFETLFA